MSTDAPFDGMTVLVTGEVDGLSREQAQAAVVSLGGKAVGSISGKTGLVVAGDGAGHSKMAKASFHRTPVMSGEAFLRLLADPAAWGDAPLGEPVSQSPAPVAAVDATTGGVQVAEVVSLPVRERAHAVGVAVLRTDGVTEARAWCKCGARWLSSTIHAVAYGCPVDPERPAPETVKRQGMALLRPADEPVPAPTETMLPSRAPIRVAEPA